MADTPEYPKWLTLGADVGKVLVTDKDAELAAKEAHDDNVKQGKDAADPRNKAAKKY